MTSITVYEVFGVSRDGVLTNVSPTYGYLENQAQEVKKNLISKITPDSKFVTYIVQSCNIMA